MFNVGAVVDSIRRHLVAIIVIFVLALGAGVVSSYLKTSDEAQEINDKAYTAEATVYVTLENLDGSVVSEASDRLISDARRTVIGDAVAGEIRRTYGSEVTITSPFWEDSTKNDRFYTHYIFVDVSAPSEETALAAANQAVVLAADVMGKTLPVKSAIVSERAYLKQGDGASASDRGSGSLENIESAVVTSSSISVKKLLIFGFLGLFGAIFVFACLDILSRRVRSERDVERMLDLPVLGSAKDEADYEGIAAALKVLLKRNDIESVAIAGVCPADGAAHACEMVAKDIPQKAVCVESLVENGSVGVVAECQSVVLTLTEGAASGKEIDHALKTLRIADTPVAGVVFIPKKKK